MSKTLLGELKKCLIDEGYTFEGEKDKELEKLKKNFVDHLNSMNKDIYDSKKIEVHMIDFAKSKSKKLQVTQEEEPEIKPAPSNETNLYPTIDVTLEELQNNKHLIVVGADGPQNLFWDGLKSHFVRGPDTDSDENLKETKFENKTYYVGLKTGRVYQEVDDIDIHVGFVGVGKFKNIELLP
jgi:hypothetical protein